MRFALVVCIVSLSLGCKEHPAPAPAPSASSSLPTASGPIAARVGSEVVTVAEVEAEIRKMPEAARAAYQETEAKKKLIQRLAQSKLLALVARERGLLDDPEVRRVVNQALVNRLLEREVDEALKEVRIAPAEVDRYLKEHPGELSRPDEVHAAMIVVANADDARRLLPQARAAQDAQAFGKLATEHSTDASRRHAGDLGFFAAASTAQPQEVVEAAFALKAPGDTAGPIETDQGFAIVRLLEKRAGYERPLETVRPRVEAKLREKLRTKRIEELVQSLKKDHPIEIVEESATAPKDASVVQRD